jgi:uncharacterized membrane protein YfcA
MPDDRRERPVDVEQNGGTGRIGPQRGQGLGERDGGGHASSMPRMSRGRWPKLAVIGTAAGVFSGLFGVGGGTVIVPLLVLWLGYGEREATGTSLAAIAVIATLAATTHGAYGNVHLGKAVLVGLPAIGGVMLGTWLQQHVRTRTISLLFSALLVAVAVDLLVR